MNILVLCGGLSRERDVSISTGIGAARALSALGHRVALVDLYLGCPSGFADPEEVFERGCVLGDAAIGDRPAGAKLQGEASANIIPQQADIYRQQTIGKSDTDFLVGNP